MNAAREPRQPASPPPSPLMTAALAYAARGVPVFPLIPGDKKPVIPKTEGGQGYKDATTDPELIRMWWRTWRMANIGIATGDVIVREDGATRPASGWLVVDIDTKHGATYDTLAALGPLPKTLMAQTATGGLHLVFAYPAGEDISISAGQLADGLDIRARGGYIAAAPSRRPEGMYEWVNDLAPAPCPSWLVQRLKQPKPKPPIAPTTTRKPIEQPTDATDRDAHWLAWALALARPGTSDETGFKLAQQLLLDPGVRDSDAVLRRYAREASFDAHNPFTDADVARWLSSAAGSQLVARGEPARNPKAKPALPKKPRKAATQANDAMPAPQQDREERPKLRALPARGSGDDLSEPPTDDAPEGGEHRTDMGNARRFVRLFGEQVRYIAAWGKWLVWDDRRWRVDETGQVERLAKATVKAMWREVADIEDKDARDELVKWVYRSEASARLAAMLDVARSEPEIAAHHGDFDAQPWLLNVLNGTIDLKTGALRPHDRADLLTKLAPVTFDPHAQLPLWDRFVHDVTGGDEELARFLQRAVGYTLTGDTGEEKLFFAHGPTRTGKSTFFEAVKATLGDYAQTADFETFLQRQQTGGIRNDIADLVGARMVASIEVDDGKKLAAGLVKTITGGDTIKARHLYKEGFAFRPTFKLWLAANDEPRVDASDGAMWSRILKIKFDAQIARKDPRVKATLRSPHKAGPAILAWAVRGCLEWQQDGLGVPQAVTDATEEYRQSMDPLRDFLTDCCELDEGAWFASSGLRETYEKWCKANGERYPLSGKRFGDALARRGCVSEVRRMGHLTVRGWRGIRVVAEV